MTVRETTVRLQLPAVEVTAGNLGDVVVWLRYSFGECEVGDGCIYTNVRDWDCPSPLIQPGNWLIRVGPAVAVLSAFEYAQLLGDQPKL